MDSSERQFGRLVFRDYMLNIPNAYYSSMDHIPLFLSVFMFPLVPFLIYYRNKKFNNALNIGIYVIKLVLPFMIIYVVIRLLLLPFTYLRILYCIL